MPRSTRGRVPSPYPPTLPPRPYWGVRQRADERMPAKWEDRRWCENCERRLNELKKQAIQMAIIFRGQMVTEEFTRETTITKRIYEKLHVPDSDTKIVQGCCEVCYTHVSQLKNVAVAMVQSLEMSASQPPGDLPSSKPYVASHHHHVHHHLHLRAGISRIPTPTSPCGSGPPLWPLPSNPAGRVSSPMPRSLSPVPPPVKRMSRQGKVAAVPKPVAQQAQRYLEQNIQAWMQPQNQLLASSLTTIVSPREPCGVHTHSYSRVNGLSPSGNPQARFQPALTSPCSAVIPLSTSFPHSLSFSGYSATSPLQGTSYSSPCATGNYVITQQPSAAASFFARAAQRLNLSTKKRRRHHSTTEVEGISFKTNFCEIIRISPPPAPPALLRTSGRKDVTGLGKVKVMLRISSNKDSPEATGSTVLNVDQRKKQVTVYETTSVGSISTPAERRVGVAAPKMFAFDAIFSEDDTQAEVCASSLTEVIQAVVNGTDGCLFVYGHSKLGKSYTMVGGSDSTQDLGIIPCAISWLFRLINEQKQKTGARFSVRVSAVEIVGRNETLKDLLAEHAAGTEGSGPSPAVYLRDDPVFGTRLMNQSELRAPTAEKTAFLLDAAIAARARCESEDEGRNSHFMFTLHVYQYRVEKGGKGGVAGGRSRLHLFDLGSCERQSKPRESGGSGCLTLSALGNVILALFNGQKHVPYKDSKLTQLLREALGSLTCRAAMLAHVSPLPDQYAETLSTIQLAARIHRMRRKKLKYLGMSSSEEEKGGVSRPFVRSQAVTEDGAGKSLSSDPDYTSSSEQSCDTVIYVGATGQLTDNEGPPSFLPILAKMNKTPPPPKSQEVKTSSGDDASGRSALTNGQTTTDAAASKSLQERSTSEGSLKAQTPKKTSVKKSRVVKQDQDSGAKSTCGSHRDTKMQSDEMWIDRPRFAKPRFDSRTLHGLQKEQWVDGPGVNYGLMDDHKQDMIRRWVEEHSRHVQEKKEALTGKKEVWIDFPKSGEEVAKVPESPSHRLRKSGHDAQGPRRLPKSFTPPQKENVSEVVEEVTVTKTEAVESENEAEEEMVEEEEEEEPVQMQDSCLQVCEEDILTACWLMDDSSVSENQHGELDRESLDEHPLRVLSAEGLNLASSFADSRSVVSNEMDCASVPDECRRYVGLESEGFGGLTWRIIHDVGPGRQCRLPSYQEAVAQKLERLARMRESSLLTATKLFNSDDLNVRNSNVNNKAPTDVSNNIPARTARLTMSEMLYGSQDSSLDELSAEDVTSIHSEPVDMDLDRCDLRFNVKPMNGLKLEAFYNRLYNTTSFLERAMQSKPGYGSKKILTSEEEQKKASSLERRRNMITALRHPDGASNPNLNKHPSVTQLNVQVEVPSLVHGKSLRSPGNGASSSDVEDNRVSCAQKPVIEERSPSIETEVLGGSSVSDRQQLVSANSPAQSPTNRMSRLSRILGSKEKNGGSPSKHSKSSPKMSHKLASPTPNRHQAGSNNVDVKMASPVRIPTRSSPTSSSSGTLVMCCNSGRSGKSCKSKQPFPPLPSNRHSPKLDKHKKSEVKSKSKSKLLARSSSSPVTSCDEKDDEGTVKKRTGLPSPYSLITKAKVHQHSSSGHGSDSSVTSGGRDGKEPLMKGMKGGGQQCSGTSSGYESMLRDSEGTPLSSSSQDSECDDLMEGRGRKGKRKKTQGSTKRSQSAPARVPNEGVPLQQCPSVPVDQQPMPSRGRGLHRRRNGQLRRSEEEVCCTGLLCCRLLDFY